MALSAGTRIGPYEISGPLGSGGMGEVYRAKDPRLGRDVAIKVLAPQFAADSEAMRRFEREARATGALNHPNIVSVFDVGTDGDISYIVVELLHGSTLRSHILRGPLSPALALDFATQLAHGLAAAHARGVVHRDLKPENLFITDEGRLKILDFGIAKLLPTDGATGDPIDQRTATTASDVILGTSAYFSPEQVLTNPVDNRSDLFTFGAILYEMLTGEQAFRRPRLFETMKAIAYDEPEPLNLTDSPLTRALEEIVLRCLRKEPENRFQSARDLGFLLETLAHMRSGSGGGPAVRVVVGAKQLQTDTDRAAHTPTQSLVDTAITRHPGRRRAISIAAAGVVVLGLVAALVAVVARRQPASAAMPVMHQVTFRRGVVARTARFAGDGQTIIYSAAWDGGPSELYMSRFDSADSRPLGVADATLASVSTSGELAILKGLSGPRVLSRVSVAGGAPRDVIEDVTMADWAPGTDQLAVGRFTNGSIRIEYPIGVVRAEGALTDMRFSPDGQRIAFVRQGAGPNTEVCVITVDGSVEETVLWDGTGPIQGLAWAPGGSEVWFTREESGGASSVNATSLSGSTRLVAWTPGKSIISDFSSDGSRVLILREASRGELAMGTSRDSKDRDVSWLDRSALGDLSTDGRTIVFSESGAGGGEGESVFVRRPGETSPVRLGAGHAVALSPDGKWVLSLVSKPRNQLVLLPTGAGQPRQLDPGPVTDFFLPVAGWGRASQKVYFTALGAGAPVFYEQDPEGGAPSQAAPAGIIGHLVSPDERTVVGQDFRPDIGAGDFVAYSRDTGDMRPLPGLLQTEVPVCWSADGRSVYLFSPFGMPCPLTRYDLKTGKRDVVREISPADKAGVSRIEFARVTPDGSTWAYSFRRSLNDLFVVEGWK